MGLVQRTDGHSETASRGYNVLTGAGGASPRSRKTLVEVGGDQALGAAREWPRPCIAILKRRTPASPPEAQQRGGRRGATNPERPGLGAQAGQRAIPPQRWLWGSGNPRKTCRPCPAAGRKICARGAGSQTSFGGGRLGRDAGESRASAAAKTVSAGWRSNFGQEETNTCGRVLWGGGWMPSGQFAAGETARPGMSLNAAASPGPRPASLPSSHRDRIGSRRPSGRTCLPGPTYESVLGVAGRWKESYAGLPRVAGAGRVKVPRGRSRTHSLFPGRFRCQIFEHGPSWRGAPPRPPKHASFRDKAAEGRRRLEEVGCPLTQTTPAFSLPARPWKRAARVGRSPTTNRSPRARSGCCWAQLDRLVGGPEADGGPPSTVAEHLFLGPGTLEVPTSVASTGRWKISGFGQGTSPDPPEAWPPGGDLASPASMERTRSSCSVATSGPISGVLVERIAKPQLAQAMTHACRGKRSTDGFSCTRRREPAQTDLALVESQMPSNETFDRRKSRSASSEVRR